MKNFYTTCLALLLFSTGVFAQYTEDFESFGVTDGNPLFQADNGYAFESGSLLFYNDYNEEWASWSGFAISADTDIMTPGFGNQYSCIAGTGNEGSQSYAVSFASPAASLAISPNENATMMEVAINNNTYAYLSMLDGDAFAKKFGGITGDDPDYFLLTIKGYEKGELLADTLNHYLADYRFEDNSQDYIQNEWVVLDIVNALGYVDSLSFHLSSTDVGQFGMNTPAYFCMDDLTRSPLGNTSEISTSVEIKIGPNPTQDFVTLTAQQPLEAITLFDIQGNVRYRSEGDSSTQTIDLSAYASGIYTIFISYEGTDYIQQIVKL